MCNKFKYSIFIIFFSTLVFSQEKLSIAPINPIFIEYQSKNAFLKNSQQFFGYIPSPHNPALRKIKPTSFLTKNVNTLPSTYDLREFNKVTSVKDQGFYGNCWAFASIASMESCLMPSETNDFSENNLSNLHGYDSAFGEGGNCYMALAYFTRWDGPVNEIDDPYPHDGGSPIGLPVRKHLQQALFIPDKTSPADITLIKSALVTYGAIYTVMRWDDSKYNSSTYAFYNPSSNYPNHAVTLVGWDDNFDRNKFNPPAPGNGAFLVKNSWGDSWGSNGYFWISYYDYWIGTENCVFNNAEPTNNYNTIFQYDHLGWCADYGYNSTIGWGGNIFYLNSNTATIYAVSTYCVSPNTELQIYIYSGVSSNNPRSGTLIAYKTITNIFAGYHTIDLDYGASVTGNFSVVIRYETPSYSYPIPVEYPFSGYSSAATASPYQSFISSDGFSGWIDCGKNSPAFNVCIKAFGTGSSATSTLTPSIYTPLANDFDGDRRGDIALYCSTQSSWYVLLSRYNLEVMKSLNNWGGNLYTALGGRFDNDLLEDPIIYYAGNWYFLSSQSGYNTYYSLSGWGGSSWQPVTADFNGDEYVDLGLYNDGAWYVLLSQGSPLINDYLYYAYGYFYISGATPLAGDVDGDRLADPILFSKSSKTWYVLLSTSGYNSLAYTTWGNADIKACVGDVDGDRKADAVTFDNSTGRWKALLSSSDYRIEAQGVWKP